jgi:hypothetical protein
MRIKEKINGYQLANGEKYSSEWFWVVMNHQPWKIDGRELKSSDWAQY